MVAENEDLILPTILSRCQLVKINALETSDITEALIKRGNIDADKAQQTAAIAQGNYREALQFCKMHQKTGNRFYANG